MDYWKTTLRRSDNPPAKAYKAKPMTQLKITYYWAVKKGPIPVVRKMQCRIVEVHAPQRIFGDKKRVITASGWDSVYSQSLQGVHRRQGQAAGGAPRQAVAEVHRAGRPLVRPLQRAPGP